MRIGDGIMQDYAAAQLMLLIEEQLVESNLKHSTVHGTGFGPVNERTTGRLPSPLLLVQVVAVSEIVRPHKPRAYKLRLSDGGAVVTAVAFSPSSNHSLSFYDLQLGYKVSQSYLHLGQHCILFYGTDAA